MLLASLGILFGSLFAYRVLYTPQFPSYVATPVNASEVCLEIASEVSSASEVFFPGTGQYDEDIHHHAISSSIGATCSFEPATPEDVGIALQILGRNKCPFAVKCGGHTTNPGFSSTSGVQIAMRRFSDVIYDNITQTAKIGAGLIWDDVYAALEPHGVNVAGGRASGIGVGGFTLGGGYSWHANQYGLTADTVEAFELVLPNGTVANVDASQVDLFFGLKGGFNNFGIVTQFVFRTFPQTQIWGGLIVYGSSEVDQLIKASAKFAASNTNPKANMIASYGYTRQGDAGGNFNVAILFYDAPSPPAGLFDDFLTTNSHTRVFTRSFLSLVQTFRMEAAPALRLAFHTTSVLEYPEDLLKNILDETISLGTTLPLGVEFVYYNVQPFLPNVYNHTTSPTAWPGSRAFFSPLNIAVGWAGDGTDEVVLNRIQQSLTNVRANTTVTEQLPLYPNYALADTPLEAIYGENVERLRNIARKTDPGNVMGLAGGFKFQDPLQGK